MTSHPASLSLIASILEIIYDIIKPDQLIHHISFQIIEVIHGILKHPIQNNFVIELCQVMLFRIAMPKIIFVEEEFFVVLSKYNKGP